MEQNKTLRNLLTKKNNKAWEVFLDKFSKLIFSTICKYTSDYDDKMDLFVFVCQALSNENFKKLRSFQLRKYKGKAKFSTWLVLVVQNLCIDWYRNKEGRSRLSRAITRLSPDDQMIFKLIYLEGNTYREAYEIVHTNTSSQITLSDFNHSLERISKTLTSKKYEKIAFNLRKKKLKIPLDDIEKIPNVASNIVSEYEVENIPDINLYKKELMDKLLESMIVLTTQEKFIIKLWFDQGLTASEISVILMDEKPHSIYVKIKNILNKLKLQLQSQGISWDDIRLLDGEK